MSTKVEIDEIRQAANELGVNVINGDDNGRERLVAHLVEKHGSFVSIPYATRLLGQASHQLDDETNGVYNAYDIVQRAIFNA
jgi:hypothetical protein